MGAMFTCEAGDYQTEKVDSSVTHVALTGHTLVRTSADGTTVSIGPYEEEEDD